MDGEGEDKNTDTLVEDKAATEVTTEDKVAEDNGSVAENVGDDSGEDKAASEKAAGKKPKGDKVPTWAQERFDELTAQRHAADRKAAAVEEQNKLLLEELAKRPKADGEEKPTPQMTEAQIKAEAERRAGEMLRAKDFNEKCDAVFDRGVEEYPDFKESLGTFKMLGGLNQDFLESVTELQEGHKVLHHLGQNPEEAQKVLKMGPKAMAINLARIEAQLNVVTKKDVSTAPKPVKPIDGKSTHNDKPLDDPKIGMEEYIKRRNKQLDDKRKQRA